MKNFNKKLALSSLISVLGLSSVAFAALSNANRSVIQVDAMDTQTIFVFDQDHVTSCTHKAAAMCSPTNPGCENMKDLALAALLSGRQVEFDLAPGQCVSGFPVLSRFRIK